MTIREKKEIRVGGDPVATLGAFETADMKEGLSLVARDKKWEVRKEDERSPPERDNHATILIHDRQVTSGAYLAFSR